MGAFGGIAGYGGGPERAGCGSYCSALDDLSRQLLEEDTTEQLQLQGYQGAALDAMVHSRVTTLHGRRVAMNTASWEEHEVPRTPENTVTYEARLDERDGRRHLYHPEAQQYVHDMFRNSQRVSQRAEQEFGITGLYNRQEHEAFLRIEQEVLSGRAAAGMWAAYDPSGTVRYVSQIENQEGVIKAKWIDIGLTGGDLTPREAVSLLHRIAGNMGGSTLVAEQESSPYLLMKQEAIRAEDVWKSTKTLIDERPFLRRAHGSWTDEGAFDQTDQQAIFVGGMRFGDIAPQYDRGTRSELLQQVEACVPPGVAAMGALKIAEVMHTKINDEGSKFHGFSLVELIDRHVTPRVLQTTEALFLRDKAPNGEHTAQKDAAKKRAPDECKPRKILVMERRIDEKHAVETKAVKKSIERHAKKELRRKNKELRKVKRETKKDSVKVQPLRSERVEPLRAAKERKARIKRSREIGVKKVAAAKILTPMEMSKPDKQERREKNRLRRSVEKSVRRHKKKELRRKAKREAKKIPVKVQPLKTERVEPFIERKQSIHRKEREAVVGMVFGWVVWMMLMRRHNETPKNVFIRSHLANLQGATLRSRENQEETPWILLSIIYYLTAIREQAMHNYPVGSINSAQQTLPQYAVIFAYAS